MNDSPCSNRDSKRGAPSTTPSEYSWIALVIAAALGGIAGHLLWRKPLHLAAFAGTIGYLVGALIDRARRH